MVKEKIGLPEEEKSDTFFRDKFMAYVRYWPVFLFCILICMMAGFIYSRYTEPKYIATTLFLVKGAEGDGNTSQDLIETALSGKRQINLSNEMLLIGSRNLIEKTVTKNRFNISYYKKGRILDLNIYMDAPFKIVPESIADSNRSYSIRITDLNKNGGLLKSETGSNTTTKQFLWKEKLNVDDFTFILNPEDLNTDLTGEYLIQWRPVYEAANEIRNELIVKEYDSKSSVIELSIKTDNLQKGIEILDAIYHEFNLTDKEDRSKISDNTISFINERLLTITNELKGVEGAQENFQVSQHLVDIKGQSAQSLESSSDFNRAIKDLSIQQSVVSMISEYFANPSNAGKLLPSVLGLSDPTLASLVTQYNDLQLKKERELPVVAPNSTVMQDLNSQISSLRNSILESLESIKKNLKLQQNSFVQQNDQHKNFLSSIPKNERVMQEIRRKQAITEGLYLYLFQKREEAAISNTSSRTENYRQIDPASGYGPVEPNQRNIIVYTALLGFVLASGLIYLREFFNDKILSLQDIKSKIPITVFGSVNQLSKRDKKTAFIFSRTLLSEQFRSIRTNLFFHFKNKKERVILVTSSMSGEGKSFISFNLAAVCAIPGKKVALVDFDLRKPVVAANLGLDISKGIVDFLNNDTLSLADIYQTIETIPTLHIYTSGNIPQDPSDLLMTSKLKALIDLLKAEYEYVIIDSPPVGIVSDALIIEQHCDLVLYVVRQGVTSKKQIDLIREKLNGRSYRDIGLILNDIKKKSTQYENYQNKKKVGLKKIMA